MKVILYARVSTMGQAERGYSLRQQVEALQEHAAKEGYDVLAEIADDGYSGTTLERPGMDRVREMVETGGVDLVIAQDRDRIAREPAFHYLLETEFKKYGTKLAALNDWGGDTPEGQLLRGIQDQIAKYERLLIAERTRRGKLRRAKEGKIVPTGVVPLGFEYVDDTYVAHEPSVGTVRRIFELAAAGNSMYRVRQILNKEGVGTPRGGKFWSPNTLRLVVGHDIYLPREHDEVAELVDVRKLARPLDPDKRYGVVWYSHIAIPVAESGIPRETVEAARSNLKRVNRAPRADNRFWELHGHVFCSCGAMMLARVAHARGKSYAYYVCSHHVRDGKERCPDGKWINAANLEHEVYHALNNISPQDLETQIQRLIDKERAPEQTIRTAHEVIENVATERDRLVRLYTTGKIDDARYDAHAAELQQREDAARGELERLQNTGGRIERLRLMKRNPILRVMGQTKEMRRDYYKDLELRVTADRKSVVIRGVFGSQRVPSIQMKGTTKA
ncbi:MAG: recombinase family protein [Rubrobacteraceae bacterium]|nr:recombinase family protein [Rubrobacteraceae bacterium]